MSHLPKQTFDLHENPQSLGLIKRLLHVSVVLRRKNPIGRGVDFRAEQSVTKKNPKNNAAGSKNQKIDREKRQGAENLLQQNIDDDEFDAS